MQLHFVCGKSPFLWIKAILSHEWSRVRLYAYEEIFEQTLQIIKGVQGLTNIGIEIVPIIGLESRSPMEEYAEKLHESLALGEPLEEHTVLFYSGTIPQLAILVSRFDYKSLMSYESGKFLCKGEINLAIDEYRLGLLQFLKLLGFRLIREDNTTTLNDLKKGDRVFRTHQILNIELSTFGKIMIDWRKPDTSGQRKRTVSEIIRLNELFGRHLIEHTVEDQIVQDWLKNVNLKFHTESEEE